MTDDFFSDYDSDKPIENTAPKSDNQDSADSQSPKKQGSDGYAEEIFSKKIEAKSRTYFIDLKHSMYGKFLKVSERSKGRRSTIMIDEEHIAEFIDALGEVKDNL